VIKQRKSAWPWPADSPTDQARRVAQSYRAALLAQLPDECAALDRRMVELGQSWIAPQVHQYDPMDLLTVAEVADYCSVKINTVYEWRRRGLEVTTTPDGDRHRVDHVDAYRARVRRRRAGVELP
jgi:hypothetical protein